MEVNFAKMSPTQNMTILVESPVPREHHQQVASQLMAYDGVFGEQVGFVEKPQNQAAWARLQMMGGEFCGNAAMSLAALLALDRGTPRGQGLEVPLEISGAEGLLAVEVVLQDEGARCSVEMPLPEGIEDLVLPLDGKDYPVAVVTFTGITHLIVKTESVAGDKAAFADLAVTEWRKRFPAEALGIILYDWVRRSITPLVYVNSTMSRVWERGCGSGTAAVGSWLAVTAAGMIAADISQPGGIISVRVDYASGRPRKIIISGNVKMVARGTAYLTL